jgi:hypothetical protein
MAAILDVWQGHWTQFWKRTNEKKGTHQRYTTYYNIHVYIDVVSILVFRQKNELSKNKSIRKTLVTCQHKNG